MNQISRRHWLQALGVSWVATPELALGEGAHASMGSAAPSRPPLRFVGVYMPHGVAREHWSPGPGFDLRRTACLLRPFDEPETYGRTFKQHILPIDGIDLAAGIEVGTVGHEASRVILTGSGARGVNASIDQYLAVEQGFGADTPFTSLVIGVGNEDPGLGFNLSYARGGTPLPKVIDPSVLYDTLFGAPLSGEGLEALELRRVRKRSVLDVVRRDLGQLLRKAPVSERHKLEQHYTALRDVEKRLNPRTTACLGPERPYRADFPKLLAFGGAEPYFETITNLHIDLIARALGCDLTRFCTLFLADLTRTALPVGLPADIHLDVAHRYSAKGKHTTGDPPSWDALGTQNRHTYGQIARLLQRLDEAEVLEATILLAQSDMGDPARHSSRDVPTLIAGGCGGHFQLGCFIDARSDKKPGELIPNNRLLVSIAQAFGVETNTFGTSGNVSTVTGSFERLTQRTG
jgi:hypothetical protein